ncbi:MAG: SGNH/GDSL hydrolase family protein [Planctomycetota bacterium]
MSTRRKIVFALLSTILFCLLLEVGFWIAYPLAGGDVAALHAYRDFVVDRKVRYYAPHPYTLYTFNPASSDVNSDGFLGPALPPREKPEGTLRIACLGGSTTASGNEASFKGSYPFFLEQELEESLGREVEVLNFGVNAWTTAETVVNYVLNVQDYSPDLVLIHHAVNDAGPRFYPDYRSDYSHYRKSWELPQKHWLDRLLTASSDLWAWARSRKHFQTIDVAYAVNRPFRAGTSQIRDGRFPEGSELGFVRNIRTIVELTRIAGGETVLVTMPCDERGAAPDEAVTLGVRENNALLRRLASEEGLLLIDLEQSMPVTDERVSRNYIDRVHFEPDGNAMKAEQIASALLAHWR